MTKTLTTAALALVISTGAAFAQSGGYFDDHYAPGASDYSHTRISAEDATIMAHGAQVAFQNAPAKTTGSVNVAGSEPAVIFAGAANARS